MTWLVDERGEPLRPFRSLWAAVEYLLDRRAVGVMAGDVAVRPESWPDLQNERTNHRAVSIAGRGGLPSASISRRCVPGSLGGRSGLALRAGRRAVAGNVGRRVAGNHVGAMRRAADGR